MTARRTRSATLAAGVVAAVIAAAGTPASAAEIRLPNINDQMVDYAFDSGVIESTGRTEVAFSDSVIVRDSSWMRLFFDRAVLGVNDEGESAVLRVTSMLDGAVQELDRDALAKWGNTTAQFNGDFVLIEVIQPAGASPSQIVVDRVHVGENDANVQENFFGDGRSICGSTDDRILSNEPRAGRVFPIGCTAWIINDCNKCMITAGHCGPSSSAIIQFNVPLSDSNGNWIAPPPEDQYPVDPASVQSSGSGGVGNDFAYFGTFPNTTTGLTAYEAQGEVAYELAPADTTTQNIRITGFGSTSFPVDPTWDLAQKTHVGPFVGVFGNSLQYQPDTTGGNSGSPVLDEENQLAIGVHTHAGCNLSTGQGNQGTHITAPGFQAYLNNPQGICAGPQPIAAVSDITPDYLDSGVSIFDFEINSACGTTPNPNSATMYLDRGNGFEVIRMNVEGANATVATPPLACGGVVSYYFEIQNLDGSFFTIPANGASEPITRTVVDSIDSIANFDFETDAGFVDASTAGLSTGQWERVVPSNGGSREDPPTDADGSGKAWVTDDASNADVDGDAAILVSPAFDATTINAPQLKFALWIGTNNPGDDPITIDISDDNGSSWVNVDTLFESTNGWETQSIDIQQFVDLTDQVRVRITVSDSPNNSVLEAGVDAFRIEAVSCNDNTCPNDINGDGSVTALDISTVLSNFGMTNATQSDGDTDGDGNVTPNDISNVLGAFGSTC